jgi:hypothetical protein
MKTPLALLLTGALLGGGALLGTQALTAQDPAQEPSPDMSPEAQMALMQEMMKAAAPGEHHTPLKAMVGEWRAEMKMRMSPEGPWEEHQGKSKVQSALGGRYLIEKFEADIGPMFGDMEGIFIVGYNNLAQRYETSWRDNWSTWPSTATGFLNEEGMMEMTGTMRDVVTPEGRPHYITFGMVDEDHRVMHMYDTIPPHGKTKVMQIDYYRVEKD